MSRAGRKRFEYLLAGKNDEKPGEHLVEIEKYALGKVRTLKEFEEFVGIDFAAKTVSQKALEGAFIEHIERYA